MKATTKVANKPAGFSALMNWVARHRKLELPLTYLMESTGVYHEAVAWYLHQQDQPISILLPNKAKYYLKSLGYNRADFYGSNKGWRMIFVIFFTPLDHRIDPMDEFIS
ncbi:hypothetical protein [Spirosoma foliorum]|uniref:hypothetical protein n=1 Tax=Spirosoma foliorum TaxID=2710596 RepID=UPI001F0A1CE6|nr:hypothetical protein [Spirosoma foliorum]